MPKPIKNYIVGVRHGGDTCYVTHSLTVGAKSERDAIEYAKQEMGKFHHYSCNHTELTPRVQLKEGQVMRRGGYGGSNEKEIDGEIYLVTDETKEMEHTNEKGELVLTVQEKYVKRYARKETDVLWITTSIWTGEREIEEYRAIQKRLEKRTPGVKQKTYHPMNKK